MTKAINFIATLMILQGFTFFCAETSTSTTISPSPTTSSVSSPTTSSVSSPTTSSVSSPTTSIVVNKKPGPLITLSLKVTTNCSYGHLQALNVSLQTNIKAVYVKEGFSVKSVVTKSISCNSPLNMALDLSFYSPIPSGKTIQGVFDNAVKNGTLIPPLTTSNTEVNFTFVGATIKFKPKAGQCQQVCCEGAGGEMTVVPECTPVDKCEGIVLPAEKKEDGHCPGDSKNTCSVKCDDDTDDSGGLYTSPSFAVVILLAFTSFIKTIFY